MTFSLIIIILYSLFIMLSYKKALLMLYPISMLFTTIPAIPGFSLQLSTVLLYEGFLYLFIIHNNECKIEIVSKYIKVFFICHILCWIFGGGTSHPFPFMYISSNILFTYVIWTLLKNEKDLIFFVRFFFVILIVVVSNGVIEFVLNENIWFEWMSSYTDITIYHSHINDIRMGYGRCCSFFDFCIPFGDFCAIFFAYLLFIYTKDNIVASKRYLLLLMIISIIGIVLANSRASFIIFFLSFAPLVTNKNKYKILILLLLLLFVYYFKEFFQYIFDSIFNSNQSDVQGSNSELRQLQLLIAINEFVKNPLFGNGMSRSVELQEIDINAAGLESHLFILLINYGLLGIVAYCSNIISGIVIFKKGLRSFPVFFLTLWVIAAFTSLTTGIDIAFPIILLITISKMYSFSLLEHHETYE